MGSGGNVPGVCGALEGASSSSWPIWRGTRRAEKDFFIVVGFSLDVVVFTCSHTDFAIPLAVDVSEFIQGD